MKKSLIFGLLLIFNISAWAQNSTQGKEFWFSFMKNGYKYNGSVEGWVSNTVMISAKRACTGTIKKANNAWEGIPFSVAANGITYIEIPEAYAYNEDNEEEIGSQSLVLSSTDTVSVYIANMATNSFDASFVLPVTSLGSEYIIQCDMQSQSASSSFEVEETSCFLIVGVENGTQIDITPSVETFLGQPANRTFTVSLNQGETYFVRSNNMWSDRDLSGSTVFVRNGKNVAVFNGNTLTCIPGNVGNGLDHIFEQALPVDTWGKQFAVTTSANRVRDYVKVTSSADNDSVWVNGAFVTTLGFGKSYGFWLYSYEGSCFIETSEPSVVFLYNTTGSEPEEPDDGIGDPSMVWIPPVEQRINEITFCTFNHDYAPIDVHYVNVVVDGSSIGEVYLDAIPISVSEFHPVVGNNDLFYVKKAISHGTHQLSCDAGLTGHVYGFGHAKGYAYCMGANVLNLNSRLYVNGLWSGSYRNGLYLCVDEQADFEVKTNYPLNKVIWDFDGEHGAEGTSSTFVYSERGEFEAVAYIEGYNAFTQEPVLDTMSIAVHVGGPEYVDSTAVVCNYDSFEFYGIEYDQDGYYERVGTNIYGCDSAYYLHLDMEFTPYFEINGTHWPIGGSETYISANAYSIHLDEPRTSIDTVLWTVDCPNWNIVPQGKGENCTMYLFSFLEDTVYLHATAINRCDSVTVDFFIKTSYFGVEDDEEAIGFTVTPNPTNGEVTLHFEDLMGEAEIELYDFRGTLLERKRWSIMNPSERVAWSITNPKPGLYFLKAKTAKGVAVKKIVIK